MSVQSLLLKLVRADKNYLDAGPHVLACAARLEGCIAALCVAGVAPYEAEGLDFLAGQGEDSKCYQPKELVFSFTQILDFDPH